jgi:insertion element IS1 protein InsB
VYRVLQPKQRHSAVTRRQVLQAAQERVSLRGIERIFGVCRQTVARWIRQAVWQLPVVVDTLLDYEVGDVLEADELWSFVLNKARKRWLWLALCRRTRQIIAFYIGKRDADAAGQLWQRIPYPYTLCPIYTDHYEAYPSALPERQHWATAKQSGATAHIERWNNTLRQRLARFVRKTLSFSKSDRMHHIMVEWFIIDYNQQIASLTT